MIGQSDPFAPDSGRDRRPDTRAPDPHEQQVDWRSDAPHNAPQYEAPQYEAPQYEASRYEASQYEAPEYAAPQYENGTPYDPYAPAPRPEYQQPQHYADQGYDAGEGHAQNAAGEARPVDPQYQDGYGNVPGYGDQAYGDPAPGQTHGYAGQQLHPDTRYYDDPNGQPAQPGYDPAQAPLDTQGGYGAPHFGAAHGPSQDDDYYEDAPGPRRRGGLITAAALLGLAVIGTAGAFAYRAVFTSSGPPAMIARDAGPNKILPAAQSADNTSGNQTYDRGSDRGQNERVVPREEQPLNIPDPMRNAPQRVGGQNSAAAIPGLQGGPSTQPVLPPDASALAPTAPGSGGEPKKIRTVTIKSDQSPGDSPAPRPVAPPRTLASQSAAPAVPQRSAANATAAPNAPLSLSPQAVPNAPPPARPAAPLHTTALAPSNSGAAGGEGAGGYFVQVSAQKSKEEAEASYRGIQAKYASVLSGRQPVFRRKDLGSKGVFYGAQVGPFSHEDAQQLCESLKSAGQSCMIQRN